MRIDRDGLAVEALACAPTAGPSRFVIPVPQSRLLMRG